MFKRNKTMNLKGKKKTSKFKIIFYLIIVYLSFAYTFYYSIKSSNTITNKEFINLILSKGNANITHTYSLINIVNDTVNFLFNIDFKSPSTILNKELLASGKKNNEIDIMHDDDYSNMEELKKMMMKAQKFDDISENLQNIEKHTKGFIYDSLCYRYQLARYKACEADAMDLVITKGLSKREAEAKARDLYERDCMRFYQILDEAIGEHD